MQDKPNSLGPASKQKFGNIMNYYAKQGLGPEASADKAKLSTRAALGRKLQRSIYKDKGTP